MPGPCLTSCPAPAGHHARPLPDIMPGPLQVNYVVQEAIIVIKDIFRKYPNRYESIIATLCESPMT